MQHSDYKPGQLYYAPVGPVEFTVNDIPRGILIRLLYGRWWSNPFNRRMLHRNEKISKHLKYKINRLGSPSYPYKLSSKRLKRILKR